MINYYNDFVSNNINQKIVKNKYFNEWFSIVKVILMNKEFQKRKLFFHHYDITVWDHSIEVSFACFLVAKKLNKNVRVSAIAGLLHDFYEFAWIYNDELLHIDHGYYLKEINKKKPFFKQHGFAHASSATKNYLKYFYYLQEEKISNSIRRHMFPLNIVPPKYVEGYILTFVDKYVSIKDIIKHYQRKYGN